MIVAPSGVPADHPDHYQNMAVTLCKENADYFDVDQYDNPNNPEAYYRTLGPEVGGPCNTLSGCTHWSALCCCSCVFASCALCLHICFCERRCILCSGVVFHPWRPSCFRCTEASVHCVLQCLLYPLSAEYPWYCCQMTVTLHSGSSLHSGKETKRFPHVVVPSVSS